MPSTYLSLHYHIVFSTKNRENLIAPAWNSRLHEYLGGTIRGLGGYPQCIGGVRDHVHILAGFNAVHSLAEIMRDLKKSIFNMDSSGDGFAFVRMAGRLRRLYSRHPGVSVEDDLTPG